jgi:hypothetical protein
MGWLDACFSDLPDPRTGNATRHDLIEVVTIALVASVCGAESCVDFADFARDRERLFWDFLKLENGLPSHDTFSRVFRLLDPAAFGACFARFLDGLGQDGQGVVAIDGKTGSHRARAMGARRCAGRSTAPPAVRPCMSSPPSPATRGWCWARRRCRRAATRSPQRAPCSACST